MSSKPFALVLFAPFMVNSIAFHLFLESLGLVMAGVFWAARTLPSLGLSPRLWPNAGLLCHTCLISRFRTGSVRVPYGLEGMIERMVEEVSTAEGQRRWSQMTKQCP